MKLSSEWLCSICPEFFLPLHLQLPLKKKEPYYVLGTEKKFTYNLS